MTDINHGTVELKLDGETYTLKPTLAALQSIDRHFGSLRGAIQQCSELSLDAMTWVICAGCVDLDKKTRQRVPELIFQEGLISVSPVVSEYLLALMDPSGRAGEGDGEGKV